MSSSELADGNNADEGSKNGGMQSDDDKTSPSQQDLEALKRELAESLDAETQVVEKHITTHNESFADYPSAVLKNTDCLKKGPVRSG